MPDPPFAKHTPHPARASRAEGRPRRRSTIACSALHVTSNFTFLTGASHPEELVQRAAELGQRAVAITDRNTLAG